VPRERVVGALGVTSGVVKTPRERVVGALGVASGVVKTPRVRVPASSNDT